LDKLQLMNWIAQDRAAWDAGFAAGESGQTVTTCPYPAAAEESLAWYSGFIEGKAKRSGPPAA
jgi:ribosome modulation factor